MPKIIFIFLALGFLFLIPTLFGITYAQQMTVSPKTITSQNSSSGIKISITGLIPDQGYNLYLSKKGDVLSETNITFFKPNIDGSFTRQLCKGGSIRGYSLTEGSCSTNDIFTEGGYNVTVKEGTLNRVIVQDSFIITPQTQGQIQFRPIQEFTTSNDIKFDVVSIPDGSYKVTVDNKDPNQEGPCVDAIRNSFSINIGKYYEGNHIIKVYRNERSLAHPLCGQGALVAQREFTIKSTGGQAGPIIPPGTTSGGLQAPFPPGTNPNQPSSFHGAAISGAGTACSITLGGQSYQGVQTAVGCVPTEPIGLIRALLAFVLSIAGGIGFLIMVLGAFRMITSAGNPDSLKAGSEMFTNAIIGILFIAFSVLLLQIIGVGILNIPGFK